MEAVIGSFKSSDGSQPEAVNRPAGLKDHSCPGVAVRCNAVTPVAFPIVWAHPVPRTDQMHRPPPESLIDRVTISRDQLVPLP